VALNKRYNHAYKTHASHKALSFYKVIWRTSEYCFRSTL